MNYMEIALIEARKAYKKGEVPIGCVIVDEAGALIAKAHNMREVKLDATCHAEIIAIKKACKKLRNWRLSGCTIYVTLEPCPMCMGAIKNARIGKVIYGAKADKYDLNHNLELRHESNEECEEVLKDFFKSRRL